MFIFSFKQIKSVLKDEESVLLSNDDTELEITRAIYDLIQVGIKGGLKKDSVLSTLADLTVNIILITSYKYGCYI